MLFRAFLKDKIEYHVAIYHGKRLTLFQLIIVKWQNHHTRIRSGPFGHYIFYGYNAGFHVNVIALTVSGLNTAKMTTHMVPKFEPNLQTGSSNSSQFL